VTEKARIVRHVRIWLGLFIVGLVISGLTAIPISRELSVLYRALHYFGIRAGPVHDWIQEVYAAVLNTKVRHPYLLYGTDWLAFGHFAIALFFLAPFRDPVTNVSVIRLGVVACALVIPYAIVFGAIREIPWWWRAIDCSFGLFGMIPLLMSLRLIKRLESSP
jgi:hypothetical protein